MAQLDPKQIEEVVRLLKETGTLPVERFRQLCPDAEMLEQSERRYRSLFDRMSSGVAVYEAVEDGADFVFKDFNRAGCQIDQIVRDDVIGRRVTDCFPAVEEFGLLEVFRRVWRTGQPEHLPIARYEDDRIAGWRDNFVYRLPSLEVVAVYDDVTTQKQAEASLWESEQKYRSLVQSLGAGVVVHVKGTVVFGNPAMADLLGVGSPKQLIGAIIHDWTEPDLSGLPMTDRSRLELRIKRPDGDLIEGEAWGVPVTWEGQPAVQVVVVDISERKRAEEKRLKLEARMMVSQKNESLGLLAGGIAHDFNNLLMGVLGYADLALLELSPSSSASESIEEIAKTARQAAELCKQLLTYSGKGRLVTEPVNLRTLIEGMAQLLRVSISKKTTIQYDFPDDLPTIDADASQLRQVVMNLIINASEALGESGVVSVSVGVKDCDQNGFVDAFVNNAQSSGPYVFLSVTDTGCGMDEPTQRTVFDPFFSTKIEGRGLGLAGVLGVVQSHNGAITVNSQPGLGSTFTVFFPASGQAAIASGEITADEEWCGTGTILVIDDESTAREVTGSFLETAGFNVLLARDGGEGIGALKANPDVEGVILDLTMPKMDGAQTFAELRKIRSDVPVIFVSGYDEQSAGERLPRDDRTSFLQKPFRRIDLLSTVSKLLKT